MKELLLDLDRVLRAKNFSLFERLGDPLTDDVIDQHASGLKFPLPYEVRELYKWKNGTILIDDVALGSFWLMPFNTFTDLDNSVQYHLQTLNRDSDKILSNLFPLFHSGGGERTFIDINPTSSSFGKIFFYTLSDPDVDVFSTYGDSLKLFVESIIKCYEDNIYYFEDDGFLNCDEKRESQIFYMNNPAAKYWGFYSHVYS